MKGAALTVCPDATLVDITHDIAPQDILGGALALAAAFRYFPKATVFVAVVDPGVGSARRAMAASAGDYRFVAPDNGLLTLVFRDPKPDAVVELTNPTYARPEMSRTFEGRDRFAPAAAWLARGTPIDVLGSALGTWHMLAIPVPESSGGTLRGEVLVIDHFGNLITSIDRGTFTTFARDGQVIVRLGTQSARVVDTYADARHHELCALFGSSDLLEIAVNGGSAAQQSGAGRGAPVVVSRS